MEPLVYFPTFEPPSDIWLKFSLLYLENFQPIVPEKKAGLISKNFKLIEKETDLVTLYSPKYDEGFRASLHAKDEVKKIIEDPIDRSPLFRNVNILRKWQNPANWVFKIYNEKFSMEWGYFCVENKLGRLEDDGILLAEELAFLFMTYLAREIAFDQGAAIITDSNRFDNFTNYIRATTPMTNKRNRFAKSIINLVMPKNLSEIPFSRIIDFRNKNRKNIRAFNSQLDTIQQNIGLGYSERDFIKSYNDVYSEFSSELLLLGTGIVSIPLAAYILLHNSQATSSEYAREVLGALGIILSGGYALNKRLVDNEERRYCKKYLTNLERLN